MKWPELFPFYILKWVVLASLNEPRNVSSFSIMKFWRKTHTHMYAFLFLELNRKSIIAVTLRKRDKDLGNRA